MDTVIEDDELGSLIVRVNPRARSLVFRTKSDAVYVSVPPGTTTKEVKRAIENLRSKLLLSRQKVARPLIDLDYKIDAEHFKLSLILGEKEQFLANSRLGVMQIVCPPQADFTDENLQNWLRKVIEESLRRNAKSMWIVLCQCEDKLQPGTLGELLGEKKYKSVLLSCPVALPPDRLCASARVVPYS